MLGLVRLLCQPKAVGPGALDTIAAWTLYTQYRALPHIGLLPDPEGCDDALRALVGVGSLPSRLWTDAYLAALSMSASLRLVTFDRDFERFGLERCLILES
jgi:predicted nucleic acid-binding protein